MLAIGLLAALTTLPSSAAQAPSGWFPATNGEWREVIDIRPVLLQRSREGETSLVSKEVTGAGGAWRCWVQPSLGKGLCGFWFQAGADLDSGWQCVLGGDSEVGGFGLRDATGKVLWEDKWAPWNPYSAMLLEGVAERGRVRVQLFDNDGKTLISQSDWVEVPVAQTEQVGLLALQTHDAVARFWGAEHAETPVSPMTDNAPNKRRLVQGTEDDWRLYGTGNWMWTDARKVRVRQYAMTERAWALNPFIRKKDGVWRTHVRTYPGTGGAGLLFKCDPLCKGGFNCWLGGQYGAGGLMLYRNAGPGGAGEALWSSPQDKWHYDEDLVLQAETQGDQVRVTLLKGDGETVIVQSPWKQMTEKEAAAEGYLAFHTWKGNAEFWGFSAETQDATAQSTPAKQDSSLGTGWVALGDGTWEWGNAEKTALRQTAKADAATCLNTGITDAKGTWRCTVKAAAGTRSAGLVFQANAELKEGFVLELTPKGARLLDLGQKSAAIWETDKAKLPTDQPLVLEGSVLTDRVVARVLSADGKTVVVESPPVYVSDTNNERKGHLGLKSGGGAVEFSSWSFERDK